MESIKTMPTSLAKQLSTRMKAKNLTTLTLERAAGLKQHSVENILRGKSKKPSAETLNAVSDVLGCTVKDLLQKPSFFQEEEFLESRDVTLGRGYAHATLLEETIAFVNAEVQSRKLKLSVHQVLECMEEIYVHSLQGKPVRLDRAFAEWFMGLVEG